MKKVWKCNKLVVENVERVIYLRQTEPVTTQSLEQKWLDAVTLPAQLRFQRSHCIKFIRQQ